MSEFETHRALGIDYGSTRIGLAVSDPSGTIATGLKTIKNSHSAYDEIARIVAENDITVIVIGLPVPLKGGDSKKTQEVRRFRSELQNTVNVPIVFQDERYTSKDAMDTMISMNTTRKQRRDKGRIDEMAAALILQYFLDENRKAQNEDTNGRE